MSRSGLLWGICFVLVGLFTLLGDLGMWRVPPGWLWPLVLIALGVTLLVAGLVPDDRDPGEG